MAVVEDLQSHAVLLRASYRRWTGRELIPAGIAEEAAAGWLETAPFAVVSHDTEPDPVFNYANRQALELFGMTLDQFTALPSRLSAEPVQQEQRARLMLQVTRDGYIDDYSGVRIAADGRRFMIRGATVWNLVDHAGEYRGQAAMIPRWELL
jgi:PAS domain-containing protein